MADDARTEADREALRKLFGLKLGPPMKKPNATVAPSTVVETAASVKNGEMTECKRMMRAIHTPLCSSPLVLIGSAAVSWLLCTFLQARGF